ncbi:head-tail connector protein [Sphingobium xenophagum]|uniref:head-tail connector protein n=1 Tax=Sphingobium xenophagum TaxID=121428 RepID=UPI001C0C613B|nr:head-tail connector protein [Sphingobium xenophagum]QWT15316.1 head-tail connector protein [Sphingobium xenophagum]
MKTTLTRDNTFLAISVEQAKLWCRIDADEEDELIEGLIRTAQEAAEKYTNRSIVPVEVEYELDEGCKRFTIPTSPVSSVTKVELLDAEDVREPLSDPDSYWVLLRDTGAVLTLSGQIRGSRTLVVTCDAGYADPEAIPAPIKQAIAVHVGSFYAGREGQDTAEATFRTLLNPYRVGGL